MNPAKHFASTKRKQHIGTFVSETKDDGPRFGWSRYSYFKEKAEGVPFSKKVGRQHALESIDQEIIIDSAKGYIYKGDVGIHDPEMVQSSIDFISRMAKYYKKSPVNVKVILSMNHLKQLAKEVIEENAKLKEEVHQLRSSKIKMSVELNNLKSKMERISQECIG